MTYFMIIVILKKAILANAASQMEKKALLTTDLSSPSNVDMVRGA